MPPDSSPSTYEFQCLFIDKAHDIVSPTGFKSWVVEVAAEELAKDSRVPVSRLLQLAEEQHQGSRCPDCPGRLLIKCGWSVSWPVADAGQRLRDVPLEHNLSAGIQLMLPHAPLSDYLQPVQAQGVISVLFECTFDRSRRMLKDEDETTADKRRKLGAISQPKGLRVLRSSEESTNPISLLPPSCSIYPDYTTLTDRVFVDKTRFIPIMDSLLCAREHDGCVLTLPKGVGKSTFLRMLIEWYDCHKNTYHKIFDALEIGELVRQREAEKRGYLWGKGMSLCLAFDMDKIGNLERSGSDVALSITDYVRKTLDDFVKKYHGEFRIPVVLPPSSEAPSLTKMLVMIINAILRDKLRLLIVVDHCDGPIQRSLECSNYAAIEGITRALTRLLTDLVRLSSTEVSILLLIVGNLPPTLSTDSEDQELSLLNISTNPKLDGAFGISGGELKNLFNVLAWGRHKTIDTRDPKLARKLGGFVPAAYSPNTPGKELFLARPFLYNFTLVLHYVSVTLELKDGHEQPLESPLLRTISRMYPKLLQYSNLRRDLPVIVPEFYTLDTTSLGTPLRREEPLWKLIFYLGGLKVTNWPGNGPDPMWKLTLTSEFAEKELFSTYPPIRSNKEPPHDIQLRALLERNPKPMMDEIAKRILYNKTLSDLYQMSEAVLQTIFDGYFDDDGGKYREKYFPQLGLLTNPAKSDQETGRRSGPSNVQPGLGRFGYADIFLAGFRNLHPGRAVVIELKMVSLWNLFLGIHENERTCSEKVNGKPGDPPDTFRKNCLTMIKRVDKATMDELRQMTYGYRKDGKLDTRAIGALLQDTEIQLRSYINAIVNGRANNRKGEKGITNAERRVKVEDNPRAPDEVIGLIVCCIGRRMITIPVEPQIQNDKYQYLEQDGWRETWQG